MNAVLDKPHAGFRSDRAEVSARVDADVKAHAEQVFESLGIDTSEAIRMFLAQVEHAEQVFESLGIDTSEAIRMFLAQVALRQELPFPVEISGGGIPIDDDDEDDDLLLPLPMRLAALDLIYDEN